MHEPPQRLEVIDLAKGIAILAVVCIHGEVFGDTLFNEHVIHRAVPLFLILFGMTSELSWQKREALSESPNVLKWYASRFRRILPPMWAAMVVWWIAAFSADAIVMKHPLPAFFASLVGFAPQYGTSWFVTVIIQLVLLFPVLRWLSVRMGIWPTCALGALTSGLCVFFVFEISLFGERLFGTEGVSPPFYYQWIFAPRVFLHIIAGMVIARIGLQPSRTLTQLCAAAVALGPVVGEFAKNSGRPEWAPVRALLVTYAFDVPLAIALLGALTHWRLPKMVRDFIVWCGAWSWGLYLGHTVVFEAFQLYGYTPEKGGLAVRAMYTLFLLAAGVAIIAVVRSALWRSRAPGVLAQ